MAPFIDRIREHLRSAGEPHDVTARELEYYEPEEASGLVAWLASGLTSEITGQLFGIDGPKLTHYGVYPQADTFYHHPNWTPELIHEAQAALGSGLGSNGEDPRMRARRDARSERTWRAVRLSLPRALVDRRKA